MKLPNGITCTTILPEDPKGVEKLLLLVFSLLYQKLYTQQEVAPEPRFIEEGDAYAATQTLSATQMQTRLHGNRLKLIAYIPLTATWMNSATQLQNYVEMMVSGDPL